jgi:hypothetical protein
VINVCNKYSLEKLQVLSIHVKHNHNKINNLKIYKIKLKNNYKLKKLCICLMVKIKIHKKSISKIKHTFLIKVYHHSHHSIKIPINNPVSPSIKFKDVVNEVLNFQKTNNNPIKTVSLYRKVLKKTKKLTFINNKFKKLPIIKYNHKYNLIVLDQKM